MVHLFAKWQGAATTAQDGYAQYVLGAFVQWFAASKLINGMCPCLKIFA